jgi:hypothetical protein
MTPGSLKHVQPGDPLRIPAGDWNRIIDATRAHNAQTLGSVGGLATSGGGGRQNSVILVRNDTGADQPRSAILGIDGPIILPGDHLDEYFRQTAVKVVVPTDEAHLGRLVVTLDPLPAGAIGRVYIDGVCPAQIDVADAAHTTAGLVPSDTSKLQSGKQGAEIVWVPPGSAGTVWGLIRLGGPIGFWAEITGDDAETSGGPYDWKMLQVDGSGAFSDVSPAVTGTANAYEVNEATVPAETRVWLTLAGRTSEGPLYLFTTSGSLPPPGLQYQVLQLDQDLVPVWDWVRIAPAEEAPA